MLNVRAFFSITMYIIFTIVTFYYSDRISDAPLPTMAYKYTQIAWLLAFAPVFYLEEYSSKNGFLDQLKIKRLIKEQRTILETLPDGLVIHQDQGNNLDVKYINSTFNNMFCTVPESQLGISQSERDKRCLSKIYLRKTQYSIKSQQVEQNTEFDIQEPKDMMQQISEVESGQVYEIVYKDIFSGGFISSDELQRRCDPKLFPERCNKFLIYIISRKVFLNDELHTLTIIKDITFGVLYEQIKAQQILRSIVNTTLKKKIGVPLQVVISSCQKILKHENLQVLD